MRKHLAAEAELLLEASLEDRIQYIQSDHWVQYPRAELILNQLAGLAQCPRRERMPCLSIIGDSNSGKTSVVSEFQRRNPPLTAEQAEGELHIPVLRIQAPPKADEGRLYTEILTRLNRPHNPRHNIGTNEAMAHKMLSYANVRVLIVDEMHHLLGTREKQREVLNAVKRLSNSLSLSIVGVGTYELSRALASDPQLANRFEPVELPRWPLNKQYGSLLIALLKLIPLPDAPSLLNKDSAAKLHQLSEGLLGETVEIVRRMGLKALQSGHTALTSDHLQELSWVPPSRRQ